MGVGWGFASLIPLILDYLLIKEFWQLKQRLDRLEQDVRRAHLRCKPGTWVLDPDLDFYAMKQRCRSLPKILTSDFNDRDLLMMYAKTLLLESNVQRCEFYDAKDQESEVKRQLVSCLGNNVLNNFSDSYRYGEKVQDTLITHGQILDYWLVSSNLLVVDCEVVAKLRLLVKTDERLDLGYDKEPFEYDRWETFLVFGKVNDHWVLMNLLKSEKDWLSRKEEYERCCQDMISTGLNEKDLLTIDPSQMTGPSVDPVVRVKHFLDNEEEYANEFAYLAIFAFLYMLGLTIAAYVMFGMAFGLSLKGSITATIILSLIWLGIYIAYKHYRKSRLDELLTD